MASSPEEVRLRRWLRLIEWACPPTHSSPLIKAVGKAARAALFGDEPPEKLQHHEQIGGSNHGE